MRCRSKIQSIGGPDDIKINEEGLADGPRTTIITEKNNFFKIRKIYSVTDRSWLF